MIAKLYPVERRAKDLAPAARQRLRDEEAGPLLEEFHAWLQTSAARIAPKSLLGEAVNYALNQ
jgi:transposase